MKVSIVDIADKAGVSIATVSRVFNRYSNVKEEVATRVMEVANAMGYTPNHSLKRETIGVLVEDPDRFKLENYGAMLYSSLIRISCRLNMRMELFTVDDIPYLKNKHMLGIISTVFTDSSIEALRNIKGLPVISANVLVPGGKAVCTDEFEGVKQAMELFRIEGHKRVGMISCDEIENWATQARVEAFRNCLESGNFQSFLGQVQHSSGEKGILRALSILLKKEVSAILVPGERWGITVMYYLDLLKKSVPEDVSVIGYDYIDVSEFLNPPQTCLRQDLDEVIEIAMNALLNKDNLSDSDYPIWVRPELIQRESVMRLVGGQE